MLAPSKLDYLSILMKYFWAWLLIWEQVLVPICLSICLQSFLKSSIPSINSRCSSSVQRPCKLLDLDDFLWTVCVVFCLLMPSKVEPKKFVYEFSHVKADWCLAIEGGSLKTDRIFYWGILILFDSPLAWATAMSWQVLSRLGLDLLRIEGSPSLVSLIGNWLLWVGRF